MAETTYGLENNPSLERQKSVFVNGRFQNPWPTWRHPKIMNGFKFICETDNSSIPSQEELDKTLTIHTPNFNTIAANDKMDITWIGHATVVVRFDNITILTDPIFSQRASFTQYFGPSRYRKAACSVQQLPKIDAVVISHNHYDHLDVNSVKALNDRFGNELHWFVPLNLKQWMRDCGCNNVSELDWYQEGYHHVNDKKHIKFVLTPAQHWCKRSLFDDCRVLWGSWSIIGPKHRFFFSGDTAYCSVFKEIGKEYGPFNLAAIAIGAYEPRWFMKYQHVDPEEAVKIHEDINSEFSVGIHWGTFALAHEHYLEPREKLQQSLKEHNLSPESFVTLPHGFTKVIDN